MTKPEAVASSLTLSSAFPERLIFPSVARVPWTVALPEVASVIAPPIVVSPVAVKSALFSMTRLPSISVSPVVSLESWSLRVTSPDVCPLLMAFFDTVNFLSPISKVEPPLSSRAPKEVLPFALSVALFVMVLLPWIVSVSPISTIEEAARLKSAATVALAPTFVLKPEAPWIVKLPAIVASSENSKERLSIVTSPVLTCVMPFSSL